MAKTVKQKGSRLGTRMRSALAEAYGQRGHVRSHLWYFYSPKADADAVVRSDLEFHHALIVESDPEVVRANYRPEKRTIEFEGRVRGTILDVELTMRDGSTRLREVKPAAEIERGAASRAELQIAVQASIARAEQATGKACTHEVMTERELYEGNEQRLLNWMRALPWIAQARSFDLTEHAALVFAALKADHRLTLGEILTLRPGNEGALCAAAALLGVTRGRYTSDLNEVELSRRTLFGAKRRAPSEPSNNGIA